MTKFAQVFMVCVAGTWSPILSQSQFNATALLGRPLRLGLTFTRSYEPYIMPCVHNATVLANTKACARPGYAVEIIHSIMKRLQLDYEVVPLTQGSFGVKDEHGNWSGMLGELASGHIDTIVGEATPVNKRFDDFVFSAPYTLSSIRIAVAGHPPDVNIIALVLKLFSMFDLTVWCFVIGTGVASGALLSLYARTTNDTADDTGPTSTRLLTVIVGVSAALFMNLYVAVLLSRLLIGERGAQITGTDALIEALNDQRLRMTTEDVENAVYDMLLHPEVDQEAQILRFRDAITHSGGVRVIENDDDKFSYAESNTGAVISCADRLYSTSRLNMVYASARKCNVISFDANLGSVLETFPFRRDFPPALLTAIDEIIIDSGDVFRVMMERYFRPEIGQSCNTGTTSSSQKKMTLADCVGLLIVCLLGNLAGLCAVIVERHSDRQLSGSENLGIS